MKVLQSAGMLVAACLSLNGIAQEFDANLQVRPRYEFRNGFRSLMRTGESATSFISQRSRLNLNFQQDKITTKLSLQNVRVWGDVPTTTQADKNGVAVFEAWAQYEFDKKWSTRLGRQVISYNNERILGGIDWIQQGQSHDAALIQYKSGDHKLEFGFALNSNAENSVATFYNVANYKSMQYGYYNTQLKKVNLSLLFLNVGYEYLNTASEAKVSYNQTFGGVLTFKDKKFEANLNAYGQSGKRTGRTVGAANVDLNLGYALSKKWKATVGHEFLSGKDQNDTDSKLKSFTPLFGTNHAHNGLMDYFFVGNHLFNVGLHDTYAKFAYNHNKWQFMVVPHVFNSAAKVINSSNRVMNNYLGTEVDITAGFKLQKDISIAAGYSQMFGSATMERLKGGDAGRINNWAWLMININPKLFTISKKEKS